MKFYIEDLLVYFPYSYIYPEQYSYMVALKRSLDNGGPCILEMPSGTGKTVSLLSLISSYQVKNPSIKLIYCSRTVPEIEQATEEARRVLQYRNSEMGEESPKTLCMSMSSRRNLCIQPRVSEERDGKVVDALCRELTSSWNRESPTSEKCKFFENFESNGKEILLEGVYSLEDLKEYGLKHQMCPYFLSRHMLNFANIVIFSYQYLLDPKIASLISSSFPSNSIVVFDEAHNIDNVCINALSINIDNKLLDTSSKNIAKINKQIEDIKKVDEKRLKDEYQRLVNGLARSGSTRADETTSDPVLPNDVIQEAVPGNIRKAEHFISLLRRVVDYLKSRLKSQMLLSESPLAFLQGLYHATQISSRTLRFCSSRLSSLLRTLRINDVNQFSGISLIADFATLVGTYNNGFLIIIEPYYQRQNNTYDQIFQFCCLDASIGMKPIFDKYRSVVITSGTLSPLDIYTKMLNFRPTVVERLTMSLNRNCICPCILTRGSDQISISTKFDVRSDTAVVRNYGALLVEVSAIVPDGIICFFTSYSYMEQIVSVWNEMGLLNNILTNKLIFVETSDPAESALALQNYKKACDSGRGAVLLSVARGKVSEGIDFDNQYGRCVILYGIPYINTESKVLRARLEFLRDRYQIRENEFLTFDAMRTASQCVGRVIRGKSDYGIMIFADKRYNRLDKRNKLPQWILQFCQPQHLNLSTDMAISLSKTFLREMGQPFSREEQLGKSLWSLEHVEKQSTSKPPQQQNSAINSTITTSTTTTTTTSTISETHLT
ncbi:transcription factor IIH component [Dictyostelium discoideum AX4]|uniref:General transcription and DNA repair factor IIH helicase subunit XPD n=1 Tax=Dictyostelium discoideum TaxID=44689 RepID=ERCC2_DICDI|nr:transcription factor IIH component [Dictyostelium discoideum AX4]Q55G81.1 RecName: Full=General transcription and DNA repair factor IIH helicase subunit XPD; Short=TFIIH subunit XPD; AltName: Full=DNA excision repair cross-complementing protein-2 homolog; AltName: Full=DNA repair protein D; AltName: Full=TFIIH basal transcription factor complex helicase repD subunit [Dictyostelium discoideum]EAL73159.1 transcription factor IIH component [Dictyostelium discoideum AX4]|eukprot:XP_647302.1 transcription factor IIH component [Dictyostelium discoideum AX4]